MDDKEFYTNLDEVIKELLPAVKHIVLQDYGRLNEVCMELTRRQKLAALEEKILYLRVDAEDDERVITDDYLTQKDVIEDANRYYQEHFEGEEYDENFEVKDFAQALDFWEANGYEIFEAKGLNYKAAEGNR